MAPFCTEYKDDSFMIPRSTSVIAKRMPAIRPGKGRAAIYVANVGAPAAAGSGDPTGGSTSNGAATATGSGRFGGMSRRFDGRDQKPPGPLISSTVGLQVAIYIVHT